MQEFTAPISGDYKLEVWGASGGNMEDFNVGAKGGYSIGYKNLNSSNSLYVCVGSHGNDNSSITGGTGGYNGGGKGGDGFVITIDNYKGGAGGGGATHIAITSNRGELKNYKDNLQEICLVAGGGGGAGKLGYSNGFGGGINGGNAISSSDKYTIIGATQTTGYAFGQGQDGKTKTVAYPAGAEGNGGGGGGFYGGLACQEEKEYSVCSGAGGSGYVGSVINGSTIAGDQSFPSPSGGTEQGHLGNGYAIISWISPRL